MDKECKVSVYLNKNGYWVGQITFPTMKGERRERKYEYAPTKKEATQKAYAIVYQYEQGEYIKPRKDSFISFLYEYHDVCSPKWADTTRALYKLYITAHFENYFGSIKLIDVKTITLDKFYNSKLSGIDNSTPLSINTVKKLNRFLSGAFSYAVKNGMIKSNPASNVILGKSEKYKPKVYDDIKFNKLLEVVKGTPDEIPIILGAGCGLRRGEVFGLQWDDIDFRKREISIKRSEVRFDKTITKSPKTDSSKRTIVAPGYVINKLMEYKKCQNIIDFKGRIITQWKPGAYSEHFKKLLEKHDLEHIRFHDLRHYNAVIMLKSGVSDKVAAERLGHAQVGTLKNVYQHVLKDMDEDAAAQIDKVFNIK
jgi:integrase